MPNSTLLFLQRWHSTSEIVATLRAYVVIGMIPYEALDKYFEFSPIDEVAHAIIQLARIEATNSYTTQVLYRLGFQWPPGQTLNSQFYNILAEILKLMTYDIKSVILGLLSDDCKILKRHRNDIETTY